jgi:hypothetical protein
MHLQSFMAKLRWAPMVSPPDICLSEAERAPNVAPKTLPLLSPGSFAARAWCLPLLLTVQPAKSCQI